MILKQKIAIVGAVLLVVLIFFGFDKKAPNQPIPSSISSEMSTVSFAGVERRAFEKLGTEQKNTLNQQRVLLDQAQNDSAKITVLQALASLWYSYQQPAMSGYFAKQIAEIKNDASSWAITGTTFYSGIEKYSDPLDKQYCSESAIFALENAISLDSDNEDYRINLALVNVANPPKENPMKGILMLRQLLDNNPSSVNVLYHLARLAVQTGQYDKALERLESILQKEPTHAKANCLMGKVVQATTPEVNADTYLKYCN